MSGLLDLLGGSNSSASGAGMSDPMMMGILGSLAAAGAANPPQAASRLPLAKPSPFYVFSQQAGGFGNGYAKGLQMQQERALTGAANLKNLNDLQQYNFWAPILGQPTISMGDLSKGNFNPQVAQKAAQATQESATALTPPPGPMPQQQPLGAPAASAAALSQGGGPTQQNAQAMNSLMASPQQGGPPTPMALGGLPGGAPPGAPASPMALGGLPSAPLGTPSPMAPGGPAVAPGAPPVAAGTPQAMTGALMGLPYAVRLKFAPQMVSPIENMAAAAGQNPDSPQVKEAVRLKMMEESGQIIPPGRDFAGAAMGPNGPVFFPSGIAGLAQQKGANAAATLPYELSKIGATGAQGRYSAAYDAWLKTGVWPAGVPGGPPGVSGASQAGPQAFPQPSPQAQMAPPAAAPVPSMTSAKPAAASSGPVPDLQTATMTGKDLVTEAGTTVPNAKTQMTMPQGTDEAKSMLERSTPVLEGFDKMRQPLETQLAGLNQIADIYAKTPTGGFTEYREEIANKLHGLGMDAIANKVMGANDVANVQQATYLAMREVMNQLKAANTGAGGRILNSEFEAYIDNALSANLRGDALRGAIVKLLGSGYQQLNLTNDWYSKGAQLGWRDFGAAQFQNRWMDKNPQSNFVQWAGKTVPQFADSAAKTKTIGNQTYRQVP